MGTQLDPSRALTLRPTVHPLGQELVGASDFGSVLVNLIVGCGLYPV